MPTPPQRALQERLQSLLRRLSLSLLPLFLSSCIWHDYPHGRVLPMPSRELTRHLVEIEEDIDATTDSDDAAKEYRLARCFLREGDYPRAITHYRRSYHLAKPQALLRSDATSTASGAVTSKHPTSTSGHIISDDCGRSEAREDASYREQCQNGETEADSAYRERPLSLAQRASIHALACYYQAASYGALDPTLSDLSAPTLKPSKPSSSNHHFLSEGLHYFRSCPAHLTAQPPSAVPSSSESLPTEWNAWIDARRIASQMALDAGDDRLLAQIYLQLSDSPCVHAQRAGQELELPILLSRYDATSTQRWLDTLEETHASDPQLRQAAQELIDSYEREKLSPRRARWLNALLPGSGYYYTGQKSAAMTALLVNTLFTAAAYHFFHEGEVAAALLTTSLELGWYVGGINGAGIAAIQANHYKFEKISRKLQSEHQLFPILRLSYDW